MDHLGQSIPNLNTAEINLAGAGNKQQVSMLVVLDLLMVQTNATEEYDGTSWTTEEIIWEQRRRFNWSWNSNCSFMVQVVNSWFNYESATEEYDGTNWTNGGLYTRLASSGGLAAGTQTDALVLGGYHLHSFQ